MLISTEPFTGEYIEINWEVFFSKKSSNPKNYIYSNFKPILTLQCLFGFAKVEL
jgi:hypothetical protein